jgi:hypothetical protein
MLQLQYKNKTITANHWDELSADEFIELFRRINASWYGPVGRLELHKWLYDNQCSPRFLIDTLEVPEKIPGLTKTLYGPEDGFRNITMGQFLFAETFYYAFLRDNDSRFLHKFLAALFLEKGKKFTEKDIDTRAQLFENVIFETAQAILFNYGAVRKDMTLKLKNLFPPPRETEKKELKAQDIQIPKWDEWMWKLSDGNTDADFDKVANSLVRNILKKIDTLIYESRRKK